MAPKLPYKAAQVVSQKVPVGKASNAAEMLAKYWEPAADDMSRAVASDTIQSYSRDISGAMSTPADPETRRLWKVYNELPLPSTVPTDRSHFDTPGTLIRQNAPLTDKVMPPPSEVDARSATRQRIRDAQEAQRYGPGLDEGTDLLGAAATVGAGALALGAGAAQADEFWTDERVAKFQAKSKEQKKQILEKLTEEEYQGLKAKLKAPAAAPAAPSRPVDYSQYMTPPVPEAQGQFTPSMEAPQAPKQGVGDRIVSGLQQAVRPPSLGETAMPLLAMGGRAVEAAEAVVQPLKQEYVDPVVTSAQDAYRQTDAVTSALANVDERLGPAGGQIARNLSSLAIGDQSRYRQEKDIVNSREAVTEAFGGGTLGNILGGFTDNFTRELSNLPLYLIDARKGAGPLERAAIGGGLSELVDPREGANPVAGTLAAGALGGVMEGVAKSPVAQAFGRDIMTGIRMSEPAQKAARAVEWLTKLPTQKLVPPNASAVAVTPAEELKKLVDAPAVGPLKGGAKASFSEARVGEQGAIETRKVAITSDGQKLANEWLPVGETSLPVRGVVLATPEAAEAFGKLDGEFGDVLVARDMSANDLALSARPGYGLDEVTIREGGRERVALQDDAALPLHELPEGDALVAWRREGSNLDFKPVRARTLQRESLIRRNLVEVTVGGEKRVGFEGNGGGKYGPGGEYLGPDGNIIVIAPDPAEKIPGALTEDVNVLPDRITNVKPDEVSRLLDRRDALLAQEALARVDASEAEAASIVASVNPAVVVQTPTGPKIAVTNTNGQPGPQPMPPGPPTPQAPTPPTPVMATGSGGVVPPGGMITPAMAAPPPPTGGFVQQGTKMLNEAGWGVVDLLVNPAARGARGGLFDPRRGPAAFQSRGKTMLLAATSASAAQAQTAIESMVPRMMKAHQQKVAPWIDALPPPKQAEFKRDVAAFMQSTQVSIADLKRKWPQLQVGIEQSLLDHQMSTAIKQQKLILSGWQERKVLPAPDGMQSIVDDLIDDEIYAARIYLAPLAGEGEMKKMLAQDTALHAEILNDIAKAEILPKMPVGTTPADVLPEARLRLEKWLGNPENIIADRPGQASTANRQGAAGLKERRAGSLEVAAQTYAEWKRRIFGGKTVAPQTQQEVIRLSMRYVKGNIDDAKFNAALNKTGVSLSDKDIKFLQAFRTEVADRVLPWQKKAMRLVTDPFVSAPFTTVRQDSLLMQKEACDAARQAGGLRSFSELRAFGIDPVLEGWREVPLDRSRFGPWAGREGDQTMFVAPEFWEGLSQTPEAIQQLQGFTAAMLNSNNALVKAGAKVHFTAKTMMTIGSPSAWASNVYGGVTGTMKAGVTPVDLLTNGSWRTAVGQWQEFVGRPNAVHIPGQKIPGSVWMREGMKYGTVGADAFSEEMQPMMKALLRADVLGSVTGIHSFGGLFHKLSKLGFGVAEKYTAIDSVFRHGTWLTLLKKGGVDLETGKLLDRKKAELLINGSRFRQAAGPAATTTIDLMPLSDEAVVEALKQAMAWRVRRAFSVPGQPGVATKAVAAVSNASLGTVGNLFARTAMEEARSNMMLPYRAATEPGVAGALLQWGALAGATGLAIDSLRRSRGLTDEDVQTSLQGLPTTVRSYSPQMMGLWDYDDEGRVIALDVSKIFEPLRYTGGDATGRPIADQMMSSPGQLGARTAYNILVGSAGGSSIAKEQVIDPVARAAGLQLREPYQPPELTPGPVSAAMRIASYLSPGVVRQLGSAYERSQDPAGAGAGEFVKPLTAGALTVGGTPTQAAKNTRTEREFIEKDPKRQGALDRARRKTEDEDRQQMLLEERNRLRRGANEEDQ